MNKDKYVTKEDFDKFKLYILDQIVDLKYKKEKPTSTILTFD